MNVCKCKERVPNWRAWIEDTIFLKGSPNFSALRLHVAFADMTVSLLFIENYNTTLAWLGVVWRFAKTLNEKKKKITWVFPHQGKPSTEWYSDCATITTGYWKLNIEPRQMKANETREVWEKTVSCLFISQEYIKVMPFPWQKMKTIQTCLPLLCESFGNDICCFWSRKCILLSRCGA